VISTQSPIILPLPAAVRHGNHSGCVDCVCDALCSAGDTSAVFQGASAVLRSDRKRACPSKPLHKYGFSFHWFLFFFYPSSPPYASVPFPSVLLQPLERFTSTDHICIAVEPLPSRLSLFATRPFVTFLWGWSFSEVLWVSFCPSHTAGFLSLFFKKKLMQRFQVNPTFRSPPLITASSSTTRGADTHRTPPLHANVEVENNKRSA